MVKVIASFSSAVDITELDEVFGQDGDNEDH